MHPAKFLEQYDAFWENPNKSPVMWVALLFGILCQAAMFQYRQPIASTLCFQNNLSADGTSLFHLFREKAAQCLTLGNYTKPSPHTLEALIVYTTIEQLYCTETEVGMWILSGIIVRVAMRAGYHRDPSHSPQISPFEGEMRRRIWACIYQNDLLLSYQVGLASMVGPSHCDTELPKNYTDGDLNETMETLPEPRPETDATPTLGFILRQRLLVPFREVYDFTTTARGVSSTYSDVLDLDKKIHAAYSTIPDAFRPRTRSQALADQPWLNLRRLDFQLLLHRMRCLLHRKYIALAHAEPSYRYSRDACVDAAVYILQFQQTLIKETEPDGTLHSVLWKLSSFLINDFLLATTILCLDIDRSLGTSKIRDNAALSVSIAQLQTSFPIWNFSVATSRESRHAVEVIRYILKKAACAGFEINPEILVQDDTTNSTAPQPSCVNSGELDSMNAELPTNLGCESDANSTSFAENTVQDGVFSSLMFPGVLSSDTEDLDWSAWDSQFQLQQPQ